MAAAVEKGLVIGPLNSVNDLWGSPHFTGREYWVDIDHPELNDVIAYPGPGVKISEAPLRMGRRAPLIGEHNKETYQDELGYSSEQLVRLKASGVI
jgi:crotonobetainyl-CoA:carnitine CoA-transferase CaiB-like acyl-CoA transferase